MRMYDDLAVDDLVGNFTERCRRTSSARVNRDVRPTVRAVPLVTIRHDCATCQTYEHNNGAAMKVLVIGSIPKDLAVEKHQQFMDACKDIGRALSRAGMEIVVGSDLPSTADRYVVEGADESGVKTVVWIIHRHDDGSVFSDVLKSNSAVTLKHKRLPGTAWYAYVPQILDAHAVLLIGGRGGTLTAGHIAPALHKATLAIGSFGGDAKILWQDLEPLYARLGPLCDEMAILREAWRPEHAELVVKAIGWIIAGRVFDPRPRLPIGVFLCVLLACLVAWVELFVDTILDLGYALFVMVAIAGILGTFLRTSLRLITDATSSFSWNQLLLELAAGLMLGFALVLLYLVGALVITGQADPVVLPDSYTAYQRVAVAMTMLGLGAGLLLEQAAERVKNSMATILRQGS